MVFDSQKQKMYCKHCGTEKSIEEAERTKSSFGAKTEEFKHYTCPSCGAEILTDEHTAATFCSFCGSPSLIEDRLSGEKTPALIIPFKINREQAVEIYRNWCKRGILTPKDFLKESTIEKISGIYVPFWLYDYSADASITANCTRVRMERRGDIEYTHTDHFVVQRDVSGSYSKVPADASEKMKDDVMEKLEPFSYTELKTFEMPYLSGYLAEKFNFTSSEMKDRAEGRIKDYIMQETRNTIIGYSTTMIVGQNIHLEEDDVKYTMLPVWILNYRYKNKPYLFAINGQTGKLVGNLPIDKAKTAYWFTGITAAVFAVLMLIGGIL